MTDDKAECVKAAYLLQGAIEHFHVSYWKPDMADWHKRHAIEQMTKAAAAIGFELVPVIAPEPPNAVFSQAVNWDSRKQVPVGMGEENLGGCK